MSTEKIEVAISALKSGDKVTAKRILSEVVKVDPTNEKAWLWLSTCVDSIDQKRYCLNRVLSINPTNERAQMAIAKLVSPIVSVDSPVTPTQRISGQPKEQIIPAVSKQAPSERRTNKDMKVGSYVRSVLLPGERILAVGKLHWGIFLNPILWTSITIFYLFFPFSSISDEVPEMSILCCSLLPIMSLASWVTAISTYLSTEFALTDKRVIGKSGLIRRQSLELVLSKVESVQIKQSILVVSHAEMDG
ncbi:MAG: PH domain-containing protein [Anaerolineales bacterium]|nr:PH domain-containing protein [Anaerolineales bacterium]